ncbi:MAG TPA: 6-phosphogluconolactonase [Terriglobales bacterium]|jgi:6-phosphogluconolactonase|nr:6-phosphogluconolactonase [Terriglobales bacterium]
MPSTRSIEVLANAGDLFHAAAEEFVRVGRSAIGAQGRFTVALAGGSTPKALYSLLAANYASFAWNRVFLFFGDERHVPPTDPQSNYRMVNESLLTKITIPAENVFRVTAENPDAAAAALEYEERIRRFFELKCGEFPRFDLILLGMGPDGHTASLFPDSPALDEQSRLVVSNWVAKFKTDRITFTFPVLNHANEVMFMTSGADKADMLHQVLEGKNTPPFPSQRVQPSDGKLLWMIDEPAAAKLAR